VNRVLLLSVVLGTLPACTKPADKAPPPVRDEDNPVMKLPEAYADKDGLVSLTFDIAKFTDAKQYGGGATPLTLEARHKYTAMHFDIVVSKFGVSFLGSADQFYGSSTNSSEPTPPNRWRCGRSPNSTWKRSKATHPNLTKARRK
jgi:hypothetical protein